MFRLTIFTGVFLVSVAIATSGFAQFGGGGMLGVNFGPDGPKLSGFGDVDLEKTVEYWVERNDKKVVPQMELYLQRLSEVCQLDETDTTRLRFALKGVLNRRTKSASLQIEQFAYQSGLVELPPDQQQDNADVDEEAKDDLVISSAALKGDGLVALGAEFKRPFHEHPLWIATLEKTLTPQQLEDYRNYQLENNRRNLYLAIDVWVASLDSEVSLSPAQIDSITQHIRQQLMPKVTTTYPRKINEASELVEQSYGLKEDSLGSLFSPQQVGLRKELKYREPGPKTSWTLPNR